MNCSFTLIWRWNFFLFILLGICWASLVWFICSLHLFILRSPLSLSSPFRTLIVRQSPPVLLTSLFTLPVFISLSFCAASWDISSGLLLYSVSFQPVSNLFIELSIGNFVSIIFLHLKVLFGSPSDMILCIFLFSVCDFKFLLYRYTW